MSERRYMENEIKVSVIIPVYNVEPYLKDCVDSILNQTLKDINILLIDDGSTDLSGEICDRYADEYTNIRVIHKKNEGQGVARNVGVSLATGKYVYFMDSDDLLEKDALLFLYNEAECKQLDVLIFSAESFCDDENIDFNPYGYQITQDLEHEMTGIELFKLLYYSREYSCSIPMRFYNKNFLLDNNFQFPKGIIHEDEIYGFLSLVNAKRAQCYQNRFYKRRYRSGSTMTAKKMYKSVQGYAYTWKILTNEHIGKENYTENVFYDFANDFIKLIIGMYYTSFSRSEKKAFVKERREMLRSVDLKYRKLYYDSVLFLKSPFIYKQYKRIKKILKMMRI